MSDQIERETPRHLKFAAIAAALSVVVMSGISGALMDTGAGDIVEFVVGALLGLTAIMAFSAIAAVIVGGIVATPFLATAAVIGALAALWFLSDNSIASLLRTLFDSESWGWPLAIPALLSPLALGTIVLSVACLAAVASLLIDSRLLSLRSKRRYILLGITVTTTSLALATIVGLLSDGKDPFPTDYRNASASLATSNLPDPSQPGNYDVQSLTYGAGENRRRPEFGHNRDLESRTVDATALLPEWKGLKEKMRERYWGFGLTEAPLNGLIWTPVGPGPFPIALIVHGNHGMEDYSDAGYAYLGELLASRGIITVSVDENYINGTWSGDFQGKEMPLRAWLLLQHLSLWQEWNATTDSPFFGRVDMQNISLLGHSRGGEAVSIAYAFNNLPHYPDDATVAFDFGFNIRSLVAIAQVDQRYHRRVELQDVSFLTLHGSYDSDEPAYHGMRQFNRIKLAGDSYWLKAGIYIHGANHGQFNTGWGRTDYSPPGAWLLNLAPIVQGDDQRRVAMAYIAAFLDVTLQGNSDYLAFLRDVREGGAWLPDLPYVNQFTDSTYFPVAAFEEDIDVTTATSTGASISAASVGTWREEDLEHRDQRKQGSNVVVLGWSADSNGKAAYIIDFDASVGGAMQGDSTHLTFSVSGSTEDPPALSDEPDEVEDAETEPDDLPSPDFRVELSDRLGNSASVTASEYLSLAPPMRVQYLKNKSLNKERYESDWEAVLQHVEIPLSLFTGSSPNLDVATGGQIQFVFDQQDEGVVILDDIGWIAAGRPDDSE